jgi:hypothetical protein
MRNSRPVIFWVAEGIVFAAILAALRFWIQLPILLVAGVGLAVLFAYSFVSAFSPSVSKHRPSRIGRLLVAVLPGTWAAACFVDFYSRKQSLAWTVVLVGIVFHFAITRRYLSRLPKLINVGKDAA